MKRDSIVYRMFLCGIVLLSSEGAYSNGLECEKRVNRPAQTVQQAAAEKALQPLKQCVAKQDDLAACNIFVGRALKILFGNTDFATGKDRFLLANDIANGISQPGNANWKLIGEATDSTALKTAQDHANQGFAVVAAKPRASGPGHVAVVLPGMLESYPGKWGEMPAPNSASFFLDAPERVFIGCPLSVVWSAPSGVKLYFK